MPADSADPSPWTLAARLQAVLHRHTDPLGPTTRALLWSLSAGFLFCVINAVARQLTLQLHPMQAQLLRYAFGVLAMLPLVWRAGFAAYRPQRLGGQFLRGALHAGGLVIWFTALPRIPLADTTAIGFTGPIFILIGAWLFLSEPMRWERWVATAGGLAGVLVVVGPKVSGDGGWWHLLMLLAAPVFAASYLLTKVLTRTERTEVIVFWQALTVTLFTVPLAVPVWQGPSVAQWLGGAVCGLLGTLGHYCLTRSYRHADISATQSVKFLDLLWASLLGLAVFGDLPSASTLLGGALISLSTVWLARRESRALSRMDNEP